MGKMGMKMTKDERSFRESTHLDNGELGFSFFLNFLASSAWRGHPAAKMEGTVGSKSTSH
jgi:hypothetical protein